MSPQSFALVAPFEERCRWQLLQAALRSPVTLRKAASTIEARPQTFCQILFGKRELTMSALAEWAFAFGCEPRFDMTAKEDLS